MKYKVVIIGLLTVCLLCGTVSAMTGTGTQANPYIISSKADLELLSGAGYASYVGNNKYFELGADITMSGTFTPIGTTTYMFNGHFDGKNHKIINLNVNSDPSGLFCQITSGAELKNINFHNAQINGTSYNGTGVLYGRCRNAANLVTVSNVNVYDSKVTRSAGGASGGIGGYAADASSNVKIISCNVERSIITTSAAYAGSVGGISATVQSNSIVEIRLCNVNECIIKTNGYYGRDVGGIASSASTTNVLISECNVTNCIIEALQGSNVGGIVGRGPMSSSDNSRNSVIEKCNVDNCYIYAQYHNANLDPSNAGGIIGIGLDYYNGSGYKSASCNIIDCHVSNSTIKAEANCAGGICGSDQYYNRASSRTNITDCTVTNCTIIANTYATGITTGIIPEK